MSSRIVHQLLWRREAVTFPAVTVSAHLILGKSVIYTQVIQDK